eukprot:TRINITY_DN6807_c0_g1_i14.p1 TRINITY_DN6807_c0_g1~~TRINITY_DN6807_c0_g1_i14.p1  ORF type:complete len:226 (-),score=56.35 TRINITY_DN6807_c0_g1_i14:405-1082(-)
MHDLESLMKFFSKSIMYLDPFVPKGCFGASQLQKHLSMFFTNHPETNLTAGDIFATEGNQYIVRARLTRPRHNVKVWVMLLIVFDDDQESQDLSIKQCELYFDTAVLFGRGVVEENTAGNDFTDLDLVFTKTFQLPSLQHVFVEEAVVSTQSTEKEGRLGWVWGKGRAWEDSFLVEGRIFDKLKLWVLWGHTGIPMNWWFLDLLGDPLSEKETFWAILIWYTLTF